MHGFMVGLSHAVRRRRWVVIGIWVALVAFSAPFARMNGDNLSAGFAGVEGSQSETVQDALDAGDFGDASDPQIGVAVQPAAGATPQQLDAAVDRIDRAAGETDVQLAFMPSLIVLLGEKSWWLPGWLDRILPRIELD